MASWTNRILELGESFLERDVNGRNSPEWRRARMLAGFGLLVLPLPLALSALHLVLVPLPRAQPYLLANAAGLVAILGIFWMARRSTHVRVAGNLATLCGWLGATAAAWFDGGLGGPSIVWLCTVPVLGLLFAGGVAGVIWGAAAAATVIAYHLASVAGVVQPALGGGYVMYAVNLLCVMAVTLTLIAFYDAESEHALRRLSEMRDDAQASSRAKSEFLANTSHEIRTPLTAIMGYTELLLEDVDQPLDRAQRVAMLQTIRRNVDHLGQVINDVLDLSRIEARRLELELRPVRLRPLLEDVCALMAVQANAKGLQLELDAPSDMPSVIRSDATRLRQVLVNLLGNAVRFTERGGGVTLGLRRRDSSLLLEVRDSGIGMTEAQMGRIFEPFTQADSSTTRVHGGTGLGLSICARLVELMGGSLSVESTPGVGSCFRVELPIDDESPDLPAPRRESVERPPQPLPTPDRLPEGTRLLVAEDGPDNQRLIRILLERADAQVEIAADGVVAVARACEADLAGTPFDAILMDMQMPRMDGYAATRELRDLGHDTPIIALTAHAMSDERQRCLEAGCDEYLSKPIDRLALIAQLRRLIALKSPASKF